MFLKQIIFHKNIVFESKRLSQEKFFKVKKKTYQVENKRKPIYKEDGKRSGFQREIGYEMQTINEHKFTIFKKGLTIDFDSNITVIVGDNGTGKTSLIQNFIPPDINEGFYFSFEKSKEELYEEAIKNWINNDKRSLQFVATPTYYIVEKDIHKSVMINEVGKVIDKKTRDSSSHANPLGQMVSDMWDMQDFSNGENNLDFLNGLKGIENSFIVLDEPETSLSIKSQRKIRELIAELSLKNQIIIITHSEYLMQVSNKVYDIEKKKYVETENYIKSQKL